MAAPYTVKAETIILVLLSLNAETHRSSGFLARRLCSSIHTVSSAGYQLSRDNLVETKKGPTGGFKLTKPLEEITISELLPIIPNNKKMLRYLLSKNPDANLAEFFKDFTI